MIMDEQFSRNELYWGENFQSKLTEVSVAVFGLGGVGGFALEALARAGVGKFILVDFDKISKSNINRQIIALNSTVGQSKIKAWEKRLTDINPHIKIRMYEDFYGVDSNTEIFSEKIDYVIDAIDTLRSKIGLLEFCHANKIKAVSSLGAGNRMDCSKLKLIDLSQIKTSCSPCQFMKNVVSRLKKIGIDKDLPVVISDEIPRSLKKIETIEKIVRENGEDIEFKKFIPASISTVPAVCGYLMANWVLIDLYNQHSTMF